MRQDTQLWQQAIDQMLKWRSTPQCFGSDDRPEEDVLDTAIDYAVDQKDDLAGVAPPASIIPSGNGRIAMEWNYENTTLIVEFISMGVAILTEFKSGQVTRQSTLLRNPRSRELELLRE